MDDWGYRENRKLRVVETVPKVRRSDFIDATKLSLPILIVAAIVGVVLGGASNIWTGQYGLKTEIIGLRSDFRVYTTQMDAKRDADNLLLSIMRRNLEEWIKEVRMLKLQREDLQRQIFDIKGSK